jgi:hypothetical protein
MTGVVTSGAVGGSTFRDGRGATTGEVCAPTTGGVATGGCTTSGVTMGAFTTGGVATDGFTTPGVTTGGFATIGFTTAGFTTAGRTTCGLTITGFGTAGWIGLGVTTGGLRRAGATIAGSGRSGDLKTGASVRGDGGSSTAGWTSGSTDRGPGGIVAAACCEVRLSSACASWGRSRSSSVACGLSCSSSSMAARPSSMLPAPNAASARATSRSMRRCRMRISKLCHWSVEVWPVGISSGGTADAITDGVMQEAGRYSSGSGARVGEELLYLCY